MTIFGDISNIKSNMRCKILLYSINYSEGLLRELPYAYYFPERSLCYLSELRDPNKCIILIAPKIVDRYILEYHFQFLYALSKDKIQSAINRLIQICPDSESYIPLIDFVMNNEEVVNFLKSAIEKSTFTELINFAPCKKIDKLGKKLNISVEENSEELALCWGSKSGSKKIFIESNIPTAKGTYKIAKSEIDIQKNAWEIIDNNPDLKRLIIKLNDGKWGDGLGNAIICIEKLKKTLSFSHSIEVLLQPWSNLVNEILIGGAIIEEYLEDVICSPSAQGFIHDDGKVSVLSNQEQILVKGQYLGCIFPTLTEYVATIYKYIYRIGETLYKKGVFGSFGVDFVGLKDGTLYATEINIRKLGTSHAISYVESVLNSRVNSDGLIKNKFDESIYYVHRRFYKPDLLKYLTLDSLLETLKENNIIYDHASQTGTILNIISAIATCGYIEITSISNNRDDAIKIDKKAQESLLKKANLIKNQFRYVSFLT